MAVKIIGYNPKTKKRVTCENCAAILEYVEGDVRKARYSSMGDSSGHDYVNCPNCPGKTSAMIPGTAY